MPGLPFSGWELVLILVIALVVLGPGKLPDLGAAMGKTIREFRKAATDVQEATNLESRPAPAATPAAPAATSSAPAPAAAPAEPTAAEREARPVDPVRPEDLARPAGVSGTQSPSAAPSSDRPTIGG
jgi:TatA/E family protein of Tat protein translocase